VKHWRVEQYTRFPSHSGGDLSDWLDVYYKNRLVLHLERFWTGFLVTCGVIWLIGWLLS
jgi:hypothetical protein